MHVPRLAQRPAEPRALCLTGYITRSVRLLAHLHDVNATSQRAAGCGR